jgi:hypothetical protein
LLGVKEKVTDWAWDFIDLFLLVLGFENWIIKNMQRNLKIAAVYFCQLIWGWLYVELLMKSAAGLVVLYMREICSPWEPWNHKISLASHILLLDLRIPWVDQGQHPPRLLSQSPKTSSAKLKCCLSVQ